MSRKPRSLKQIQAQLSDQLRATDHSWAQIGREFQRRFHVNARVALRQARGWTQPEAAERWNRRWPDDPKTFKNFSYWEAWPSSTGYAPSLEVLDRMAQLYECSVADLLSDLDDYGAHKRPAFSQVREPGPAGGGLGPAGGVLGPPRQAPQPYALAAAAPTTEVRFDPYFGAPPVPPTRDDLGANPGELLSSMNAVGGISSLMEPPDGGNSLSRRSALLNLSSLFAVAAAAPLAGETVLPSPAGRVDPAMVENTGLIVGGLRQQNAALGPSATVQTGLAVRAMMESVVKDAPPGLTSQAWVVYGDLAHLLGWMMFNMGQDDAARFYYDDARKAAYQADDYELAANILAAQAHLSMSAGDHQTAIDHAQAAEEAAKRSPSRHAKAYAADMTARVYASAGQGARSLAALERERRQMQRIDWAEPAAERWGFYGPAFYWARESECHLLLGHPVEAADAGALAQQRFNPAYLHNNAMALARRAQAQVQFGDVPAACRALAEAARMATLAGSVRLGTEMARAREQLRPYDGETLVQALDVRLDMYRRQRGTAESGIQSPNSVEEVL
jgi:transcriptional regulator with XRE-family HTH domain